MGTVVKVLISTEDFWAILRSQSSLDKEQPIRGILATGNKIQWASYCTTIMTVIAVALWWLDLNQCLTVRSKGSTTELDTSCYYEGSLPCLLEERCKWQE